jgi:hypothetical protein
VHLSPISTELMGFSVTQEGAQARLQGLETATNRAIEALRAITNGVRRRPDSAGHDGRRRGNHPDVPRDDSRHQAV